MREHRPRLQLPAMPTPLHWSAALWPGCGTCQSQQTGRADEISKLEEGRGGLNRQLGEGGMAFHPFTENGEEVECTILLLEI